MISGAPDVFPKHCCQGIDMFFIAPEVRQFWHSELEELKNSRAKGVIDPPVSSEAIPTAGREKEDVWSIGIILYLLTTAEQPDPTQFDFMESEWVTCSREKRDFIEKCV